ncbi:hypothetical protein GLOIN_2v1785920 [Rhizophagus clarus]|uniref:Uncharacterized protein n=1 Tax=Rhizophagus clarus TaxID=94130 RepID=A0A8H3QU95_9GLOM|nr:hypothetical protein GLOIN_2v1785920 [Rhizophagus clarus]
MQTGELLIYRQGKHSKLESLLNDEDFKNKCQIWLQQQTPESRSPTNLKTYIEETVFSKLIGHIKKETISEKTCQNYMHLKEWLKRIFEYKKSKKDFDGNMLDVVLEPQLKSGKKELVQLVHQAIPIFEILHPGCIGIFCFDQSTNHNAMAGDALVTTKMNLSPRGKQLKMRDSWYINEDGEKRVQSMTFPNNH